MQRPFRGTHFASKQRAGWAPRVAQLVYLPSNKIERKAKVCINNFLALDTVFEALG